MYEIHKKIDEAFKPILLMIIAVLSSNEVDLLRYST